MKADFWTKIGLYYRDDCSGHGSGQLFPANSEWSGDVIDDVINVIFSNYLTVFPTVSVAHFEHVFFGWMYSEQSYIAATCWLTETKFHPNVLLGFLAEPIRMHVNSLRV